VLWKDGATDEDVAPGRYSHIDIQNSDLPTIPVHGDYVQYNGKQYQLVRVEALTVGYSVVVLQESGAVVTTPLLISNAPLPDATVGAPYTAWPQASGGTMPYTYSASGLPPGLSINTATGVISGMPTDMSGSPYVVQVNVKDSAAPLNQTASTSGLTITIHPATLTITSNALPTAVVGQAYAAPAQTVTGGVTPYTYSATGLPTGISINTSTGALSGSPTVSAGSPYAVTITVTDSATPTHSTASTSGLAITVIPQLTITSNAYPTAVVGSAYVGAPQTVAGGLTPYTYSATGLPAGLGINTATGQITGTPITSTGSPFSVTITVKDATGATQQTASTTGLTITVVPTLTISNAALPDGTIGVAYSATNAASGGVPPYTYSATGLPPGLGINTSTGVISGTPTSTTGSPFSVTISVTDTTSLVARKVVQM
jgi:large repetitive protein